MTNFSNNTSNRTINQNEIKPVKKDESLLKGNEYMKCEKKNLMSANENKIFDPEYGISTINLKEISFNIGNKKIVNADQIFKLEKDNFISLKQIIRNSGIEYFFTKEPWDKSRYYISDEKNLS